ncbi:rhomboid family intramembrane serine protease [Marinomonas agarivorans]|nr:rhomboid family intramembrane serine protease [Marinomonas agarivorans]
MIRRIFPPEIVWFTIIIWLIFILDVFLINYSFNHFGIRPRHTDHLSGILLFSFLHSNLYHIVSNTIPLLLLGAMLNASVGTSKLRIVMLFGAIGSGTGVWFFGSEGSLVVGASGMVFALLSFLLADAIFNPSLRSWIFAIIAFFTNGGILFSLLTFLPHISWAGHFWGFIAGVLLAGILKGRKA